MSKPKILQNQVRVRFQHCDPLGHLNNSMYIDYLINAREDHLLDNYGINLLHHSRQHGTAWVVASHQIQYLKSAVAMDLLTIQSFVKGFSPKSIKVQFHMKRGDEMCCTMETVFVHIDIKTGKPVNHSEEWMNFLQEVVVDTEI